MPHIHYLAADGTHTEIDAEIGTSIMQAALVRGLPGINADCGGACQCATCHVYVEPEWKDKLRPRAAMEEDMLDFAFDVKNNSRLSCQIKVSPALEGLVVRTPTRQY